MQKDNRIIKLRALAILIVMFGHSIILYDSAWALYETQNVVPFLDKLKDLINAIQMPLFLVISGFCFRYSLLRKTNWSIQEIGGAIKNKFVHLIIPYFAVSIAVMIPIRLLCKYSNWIGLNVLQILIKVFGGLDSGHLWFLPTLFIVFVLSFFLLSNNRGKMIYDISIAVVSFFIMLYSFKVPTIFFLNYVASSYFWFILGYIINKNVKHCELLSTQIWKIIFAVSWGGIIFAVFLTNNPFHAMLIEKASVALMLVSAYCITSNNQCNKAIEAISNLSMGMYLLHSPLIYITFAFMPDCDPIIVVLVNFIGFGLLSFGLTYIIKKSKLRVFIGY